MFKFSKKILKRWLIFGCFFLFLTTTAFLYCDDKDPVWNTYSATLSASPTDPNVPVSSLRPGQTIYIWVSAVSNYRSNYYVVDSSYQLSVNNLDTQFVSKTQKACTLSPGSSYNCQPPWVGFGSPLTIDVVELRVGDSLPPDINNLIIIGNAYQYTSYVTTFLNASLPLEKATIEVRYNGVPVNSVNTVELSVGLNNFSVHNISTTPLALSASDPRIRVNGSINLSQGFPGGFVTLQPGQSAPFILNCSGRGEANLAGVLEMQTNSQQGLYSLRLLCNPVQLPALGNQPSSSGGDIIINTAEPPQPTEEPVVDCELTPFDPSC